MLDGQKENEVISAGWLCLLLWQILIFGGAFEQEGSGGAGGTIKYVRVNDKSLKGTNLTVVARRHPFISPAW